MLSPSLVFFIVMPIGTIILGALIINMIVLIRNRTINKINKRE
jgi:hypothetical protein